MTTYWASRTERGSHEYFWKELQAGRLRQGWGYADEQDLRKVAKVPRNERSAEEHETYRHRHMLGEEGGWQEGDIVLVPNLPEQGMFALARVTGPYRYEIDKEQGERGDFGHIREVELLTEHGVANTSEIVGSGIRKTLGNRSRVWRPSAGAAEFEHVLKHANDPEQIKRSTETQRAERALARATEAATDALQRSFSEGLSRALGNAEWERVIALALRSHYPTARVEATGGPTEQGSDVTVEVPDPFGGPSWVIVVQVKDYEGEVGPHVAGQLRQAIQSYGQEADDENEGKRVVSAVLASTNASPSRALLEETSKIKDETGVPVTIVHGDALMELILRGLVQHDVFRAA